MDNDKMTVDKVTVIPICQIGIIYPKQKSCQVFLFMTKAISQRGIDDSKFIIIQVL